MYDVDPVIMLRICVGSRDGARSEGLACTARNIIISVEYCISLIDMVNH